MWLLGARLLDAREKDPGNRGERAPTAAGLCPDFQHDTEWISTRSGADIEAYAEATEATINYEG